MRVFFFYVNECGLTVHDGAVTVGRKVRAEWLDNNRETMTEVNVVAKIKSVYSEYCRLKKSFRRGGDSFWSRVGDMRTKLAQVFDIASRGTATTTSTPSKGAKRQARVNAGIVKRRRRRVQSFSPLVRTHQCTPHSVL